VRNTCVDRQIRTWQKPLLDGWHMILKLSLGASTLHRNSCGSLGSPSGHSVDSAIDATVSPGSDSLPTESVVSGSSVLVRHRERDRLRAKGTWVGRKIVHAWCKRETQPVPYGRSRVPPTKDHGAKRLPRMSGVSVFTPRRTSSASIRAIPRLQAAPSHSKKNARHSHQKCRAVVLDLAPSKRRSAWKR